MVSHEKFDVTIVRWIDGYRLSSEANGLEAWEVLQRRYEEECLPGRLVVFEKVPHDYVAHAVKYDV